MSPTARPPEDLISQVSDELPCQPKKSPTSRKATGISGASAAARKRSKTLENGEEEEEEEKKRSRGRPRLDTKDETAADRRRTQIRLAQRAYRNRKDTAITTLEQKVKDLEQANEDMGKEFMNFYDFVLSQGLLDGAPEVARKLNDTTRKFLTLGRKSSDDSSKENSDPSPPPPPPPSDPKPKPTGRQRKDSKISSSASSSSHDRHSASSRPQVQSRSSLDVNSGQDLSSSLSSFIDPASAPYEVITQPTPQNASFPVFNSQGQVPLLDNSFNMSPFPAISAPNSYAFQERSFGRRLQRTTLEAGLRLIQMENPPPHRFAAVFGFCLLFEPHDSIVRRLTASLNKNREETMSVWKYPFTNLGGAGTFFPDSQQSASIGATGPNYPTRAQAARELYKPAELTGFSMGPFNAEVEAAKDEYLDNRTRMMCQGFEGDFYDSDEVDTYLQQRGIVIPENADYVQADIDITAFQDAPEFGITMGGPSQSLQGVSLSTPNSGFPNSYTSGTNNASNYWSATVPSTGSTTMSAVSHVATSMAPQQDTFSAGVPVSNPMQFDGSGFSFSGATNFGQESWASASAALWTKTRVTIDVARLLAEMVSKAVCLGRTPGMRPKDVNRAVLAAAGLVH